MALRNAFWKAISLASFFVPTFFLSFFRPPRTPMDCISIQNAASLLSESASLMSRCNCHIGCAAHSNVCSNSASHAASEHKSRMRPNEAFTTLWLNLAACSASKMSALARPLWTNIMCVPRCCRRLLEDSENALMPIRSPKPSCFESFATCASVAASAEGPTSAPTDIRICTQSSWPAERASCKGVASQRSIGECRALAVLTK
mmetsp:Transcript_24241/g.64511  ORF Transcript_24241/g.64511 Transcript_24241/m.64511 type:complete len:203 (-) Transcript_24241:71-679(-)